jgi:hypothetical protein
VGALSLLERIDSRGGFHRLHRMSYVGPQTEALALRVNYFKSSDSTLAHSKELRKQLLVNERHR